MSLLRILFAPVGWWIDWRYSKFHDRLNGGK